VSPHSAISCFSKTSHEPTEKFSTLDLRVEFET
jgi:hypothetical protein